MHYNDIPLYPYHSDPLRIMVPRNSPPADAPECSFGPPMAEEAGGDGSPASAGSAGEAPPGSVEALGKVLPEPDPVKGIERNAAEKDGVSYAVSDGAQGADDPSTLTPAAAERSEVDDPAPEQDDAQPELHRLISAWLSEHFDIVEAMARAGEAPVRPAPPPDPAAAKPPPPSPPPPPVHIARGDRWNKWKMAEFLRQLAATHSVTAAARSVGMSRRSAYKLRSRLKGQPFDIAWEAAFRHGYDSLPHAALELALEGEEVPHYYQGELKGTHRKRHPQLMVQLLKMRNRVGAPMLGRYGAAAEFWSENWERITHRVETGSVTWDDERNALGADEVARLELPDEKQEVDRIIFRNLPDDSPKRG